MTEAPALIPSPAADLMSARAVRIEDLLDAFIGAQDVRKNSKSLYRRTLRLFFQWADRNGLELRDVSRSHVIAYKEELLASGFSTLSVSSYMTPVRRFFEWTEANRYMPNVARGVRSPRRKQEFRKQPLTPAQVKELLEYMERSASPRDYAIVNLLIRTGIRLIELIRADARDIQYKSGHRVLLVHGKGRDEKDSLVKLTDKAYGPLSRYLSAQPRYEGAPMFLSDSNNSRGQRVTTRTVYGIVKDALRAIGLEDRAYTPHSLRHTAIVNCRRAGATQEQAQMMARHASPATTQIYDSYFRQEQRLEHSAEDLIDTLY
jgi:integrase/recombinase XerD